MSNNPHVKPRTESPLFGEKPEQLIQVTLSFTNNQFAKVENLRKQCNAANVEELMNKLFIIGQIVANASENNYEVVVVDPSNASVAKEKIKSSKKNKKEEQTRIAVVGTNESVVFISDMVNETLAVQKEIADLQSEGIFGSLPIGDA